MISDHLSVEVNSDSFLFAPDQFDTMSDVDFSPLFEADLFASGIRIAGVCESSDLVGKQGECLIEISFYIQTRSIIRLNQMNLINILGQNCYRVKEIEN
jgi:hypothetical protein